MKPLILSCVVVSVLALSGVALFAGGGEPAVDIVNDSPIKLGEPYYVIDWTDGVPSVYRLTAEGNTMRITAEGNTILTSVAEAQCRGGVCQVPVRAEVSHEVVEHHRTRVVHRLRHVRPLRLFARILPRRGCCRR